MFPPPPPPSPTPQPPLNVAPAPTPHPPFNVAPPPPEFNVAPPLSIRSSAEVPLACRAGDGPGITEPRNSASSPTLSRGGGVGGGGGTLIRWGETPIRTPTLIRGVRGRPADARTGRGFFHGSVFAHRHTTGWDHYFSDNPFKFELLWEKFLRSSYLLASRWRGGGVEPGGGGL